MNVEDSSAATNHSRESGNLIHDKIPYQVRDGFIDVIILAAGKGTRINHPDLPKVLIPIAGVPMIKYLVGKLAQNSLLKPIIVVGFKYDMVQSALGSNFPYVFQQGQLGTAHAVLAAKNQSKAKNTLVLYGNSPFIRLESITKIIEHHESSKSKLTMFTTTVPNFSDHFVSFQGFGRIIRGENNQIEKIIEFLDATEEERAIKEVNPGIYIFDSAWLWEALPRISNKNKKNEYYLTDIIEMARKDNILIESLNIDPLEVFGINTKQELEKAEEVIRLVI